MFNIIDFIEVCDNAFLSYIDNLEDYKIDADNRIHIALDKEARQELLYNVKSFLKNAYKIGVQNIVINTCHPEKNWRRRKEEIKMLSRYVISDDGISINDGNLELFLNKLFDFHKDSGDAFFIKQENLDIFDLEGLILAIIGWPSDKKIKMKTYNILNDANNIVFVHDKDLKKIPNYLYLDVETQLRQCKIII